MAKFQVMTSSRADAGMTLNRGLLYFGTGNIYDQTCVTGLFAGFLVNTLVTIENPGLKTLIIERYDNASLNIITLPWFLTFWSQWTPKIYIGLPGPLKYPNLPLTDP